MLGFLETFTQDTKWIPPVSYLWMQESILSRPITV